jgi:hypothetical protein
VDLLRRAGLDVAIAGKEENRCGGRVYEMGYQGELTKYTERTGEMLRGGRHQDHRHLLLGVLSRFSGPVPQGRQRAGNRKVLHITEYLHRFIQEGKLKLTEPVPLTVTYQDPCHPGRLGEPFVPWQGLEIKVFNQIYVYDVGSFGFALYHAAYIAGSTKSVSSVAPSSPLPMATAIRPQKTLEARGIMARMVAAAVNMIGRSRRTVALAIPFHRVSPALTCRSI